MLPPINNKPVPMLKRRPVALISNNNEKVGLENPDLVPNAFAESPSGAKKVVSNSVMGVSQKKLNSRN